MRIWRRIGLFGRTIASCVVLVLGTASVLSATHILAYYRESLRDLYEESLTDARTLGYTAEPYVLLNDTRSLAHLIQSLARDARVEQAVFYSDKGVPLARFRRDVGAPVQIAFDAKNPFPSQAGPVTRSTFRAEYAGTELLIAVPIFRETPTIDLGLGVEAASDEAESGPVGVVCVRYGLGAIRDKLVSYIARSIIVSLAVTTAVVGVVTILVKRLSAPVQELAATAAAIAAGDADRCAPERGVQEIVVLARTFNRMADALSGQNDLLERQVRARTEGLQAQKQQLLAQQMELEAINRALTKSNEAAEAANRAKSEFLANMSHEIRTPMTAILGFADSLLDPTLSSADRTDAIRTIRRNGQHLIEIINDILDLSKIEAGRLEIERIPTSPIRLVAEVQSLMRVRAEAKRLSFQTEFLGPIPETVRTDPTRLRQILINLVSNGINFTEKGGVRLVTRFQPAADADAGGSSDRTGVRTGQLVFDVIDTGIGMTEAQRSRLFHPFTQADSSMTRRFGGTGLGLTISQRLAGLLGGTITVHSEVGAGSRLTACIDAGNLEGVRMLSAEDRASLFAESRTLDAEVQACPGRLKGRVLVVEDSPDNQRLLCQFLRKMGIDVVLAENGRIALEKAQADSYDLILMDMQMPEVDGYTATSQLRQSGFVKPIVALTAHALADDRQRCLKAGCTDYATKPIDRQSLAHIVGRYLSREADGMDGCSETPSGYIYSEFADEPEMTALVETFVAEMPKRIGALQAAHRDHDLATLTHLAHQLKGAAGGYGFRAITEAATVLESSARTCSHLNTIAPQIQALIDLCQRARAGSRASEST